MTKNLHTSLTHTNRTTARSAAAAAKTADKTAAAAKTADKTTVAAAAAAATATATAAAAAAATTDAMQTPAVALTCAGATDPSQQPAAKVRKMPQWWYRMIADQDKNMSMPLHVLKLVEDFGELRKEAAGLENNEDLRNFLYTQGDKVMYSSEETWTTDEGEELTYVMMRENAENFIGGIYHRIDTMLLTPGPETGRREEKEACYKALIAQARKVANTLCATEEEMYRASESDLESNDEALATQFLV